MWVGSEASARPPHGEGVRVGPARAGAPAGHGHTAVARASQEGTRACAGLSWGRHAQQPLAARVRRLSQQGPQQVSQSAKSWCCVPAVWCCVKSWCGAGSGSVASATSHVLALPPRYRVVVEGERGNRPHIYCLEQLLQEAVSWGRGKGGWAQRPGGGVTGPCHISVPGHSWCSSCALSDHRREAGLHSLLATRDQDRSLLEPAVPLPVPWHRGPR